MSVRIMKLVPSLCKQPDSKWEGYVNMRLPTFDERFEILESFQVEVEADGNIDLPKAKMNELRAMRKLVKASMPYYQDVCLTNKVTGEKYESFDDMQYCDDLYPVFGEIGTLFIQGFKLGNG